MDVDTMDLGQFSNQLIERDLAFRGDTRIYPTGYSSQLSMSAAIPLRPRQKRSRSGSDRGDIHPLPGAGHCQTGPVVDG